MHSYRNYAVRCIFASDGGERVKFAADFKLHHCTQTPPETPKHTFNIDMLSIRRLRNAHLKMSHYLSWRASWRCDALSDQRMLFARNLCCVAKQLDTAVTARLDSWNFR